MSSNKIKKKKKSDKKGITKSNQHNVDVWTRKYKLDEIKSLPDYKKIKKLLNEKEEVIGKRAHRNGRVPDRQKVKPAYFWNTFSYLAREVQRCVLQNEWANLPRLLMVLSEAPSSYRALLLKAACVTLLCNPDADVHNFLAQCYSCQNADDIQVVLTALFHFQ